DDRVVDGRTRHPDPGQVLYQLGILVPGKRMHSGLRRDVLLNQAPRFVRANRRSPRQTREDRVHFRQAVTGANELEGPAFRPRQPGQRVRVVDVIRQHGRDQRGRVEERFHSGRPSPSRARRSSLNSASDGPVPTPSCTRTLPCQRSAEPAAASPFRCPERSWDVALGLIVTSTSVPGANGTPSTRTWPRSSTVADVSKTCMARVLTVLRRSKVHFFQLLFHGVGFDAMAGTLEFTQLVTAVRCSRGAATDRSQGWSEQGERNPWTAEPTVRTAPR